MTPTDFQPLSLRELATLVASHIRWIDSADGMQPKEPRDAILYDIVRQLAALGDE
jgi:hypothetical protein